MRVANALCEAFSNEDIDGNFGWSLMAPPHPGRLPRPTRVRVKGKKARNNNSKICLIPRVWNLEHDDSRCNFPCDLNDAWP